MKSAVVAIAKNEDRYIDEWILYNMRLGFDQIVLIQNNWTYSGRYLGNSKLRLVKYEKSEPGAQCYAYNSYIKYMSDGFDFACFFDIDEFLVLKKHKNVNKFLEEYSGFGAVAFNWAVFGDSGRKDVSDGNYSVLERFTMRGRVLNKHVKIAVNLNSARSSGDSFHPYCPHYTIGSSRGDATVNTSKRSFVHGPFNESDLEECEKVAYLCHFRNKTIDECREKCKTNATGFNVHMSNLYVEGFQEEFDKFNQNEVEDVSARDFMRDVKCALVTPARDEDEYLKEWIDHHLRIGFDKIFVYQNNWRYSGERIWDESRVELRECDGQSIQRHIYTDFVCEMSGKFDFGCFWDVDEFFCSDENLWNIKDVLRRYDDVPVLGIPRVTFGDSGLLGTEGSGHGVVRRFIRRQEGYDTLIKPIVNFRITDGSVSVRNPHIASSLIPGKHIEAIDPLRTVSTENGNFRGIKSEPFRLNHYSVKTREEWRKRRLGGDAFFGDDFRRREDGRIDEMFDKINSTANLIEDKTLFDFLGYVKPKN